MSHIQRNPVLRCYWQLLTVGTAVHEISHAIAVELSGGQITDIDLTDHVSHSGDYNLIQQVMISYAPLVVNTAVAGVIAAGGVWLPTTTLPTTISASVGGVLSASVIATVLQFVTLVLAFILAATALPSFEDAKRPFDQFKHRLSTNLVWAIITLPLAVPILLVAAIPLGLTFVRSKSTVLQLLTELAFATIILLQATQTVVLVTWADVLAGLNVLQSLI